MLLRFEFEFGVQRGSSCRLNKVRKLRGLVDRRKKEKMKRMLL